MGGRAPDWDDLRIALEIARRGALSSAATALRLDQTTVARRLRQLEAALGGALFERIEGRWQPTALGQDVLRHADAMAASAAGAERAAQARLVEVAGVVRITSVASVIESYLQPRLRTLYARHPELEIELLASDDNLDVGRGESDIAVRLARPKRGGFLIRRLAECGYSVYRCRDGGESTVPGWVAYHHELARTPEMRWLARQSGQQRIRLRSNSLRVLADAVADGIGLGILPCFIADAHPGLVRVPWTPAPPGRALWLLVHPDARRQPPVAAVMEWLAHSFAADAALFSGTIVD